MGSLHSFPISLSVPRSVQIFDMLLNGDLFPYPSYYKNVTGSDNYDNILRCVVCTVCVLYSVWSVQCVVCTVCVLYSVYLVLCDL